MMQYLSTCAHPTSPKKAGKFTPQKMEHLFFFSPQNLATPKRRNPFITSDVHFQGLETVLDFDQLVVLDAGEVAASGAQHEPSPSEFNGKNQCFLQVFLFLTMVSYGSWRFSFKSSQQVLLESFRTETSAWTLKGLVENQPCTCATCFVKSLCFEVLELLDTI